jgi:hypothetical protein
MVFYIVVQQFKNEDINPFVWINQNDAYFYVEESNSLIKKKELESQIFDDENYRVIIKKIGDGGSFALTSQIFTDYE